MKTLEKSLEAELVKNLIVQKIENLSQGQWFYSVIHYGDRDDSGMLRDWDERKWLYQKQHMEGVHRRLRRTLKEHFSKDICMVFTWERHQGTQEKIEVGSHIQYGDEKQGKYHTNLLLGPITDLQIEEPRSKLKRLWEHPGRLGIPISHQVYEDDLIDLKIDLINACIRLHPDVNRFRPSVNTQVLEETDDFLNASHYCLKDITNKGLDFMDVLDTNNSDIDN